MYFIGVYGKCPKLSCFGQICLPIGQFDEPGRTSVSIYCPRCMDIFNTDNSELDGAFFGQNLPVINFVFSARLENILILLAYVYDGQTRKTTLSISNTCL